MILLGSPTKQQAEGLWQSTFNDLSIQASDDIWARWLQLEFEAKRRNSIRWERAPIEDDIAWPEQEKVEVRYPAKQFCRDLNAVLAAKEHMTRRQWVSLLEAICRLGAVTHVLWLCDVNARIWSTIRQILEGAEPPQVVDIASQVLDCNSPFLEYGNAAVPIIRDYASKYLVARLGINLILWHLEGAGISQKGLGSVHALASLFLTCKRQREALVAAGVMQEFNNLKDEQARTIICKKGIGSNLIEFARHALGQRQTNDETLRGYDQGYVLRKRSEYKSSPWVVSLGPVALLALTHCCLKDAAGPRSVQRLCQHLGNYGINVDQDDVAKGDLGRKLRMLGLVYDSPDAESGMLLVSPFDNVVRKMS
jgi:hypothetical protein